MTAQSFVDQILVLEVFTALTRTVRLQVISKALAISGRSAPSHIVCLHLVVGASPRAEAADAQILVDLLAVFVCAYGRIFLTPVLVQGTPGAAAITLEAIHLRTIRPSALSRVIKHSSLVRIASHTQA